MIDDPLEPKLSTFVYSAEELQAIKLALTLKNPWDETQEELKTVERVLTELKKRIRDFHLLRQKEQCCYCRLNLAGGGSFQVDREHIIPKSKFPALTYEISNLSVACKRCNMEYKKNGVTFLLSPTDIEGRHVDKTQYRFIHPNFEVYSTFIRRRQEQDGDHVFVMFSFDQSCKKSKFTYDYFNLKGLELNSFDSAQGIEINLSTDLKLRELEGIIQEQNNLIQKLMDRASRYELAAMSADVDYFIKPKRPKALGLPGGPILALPAPRNPT